MNSTKGFREEKKCVYVPQSKVLKKSCVLVQKLRYHTDTNLKTFQTMPSLSELGMH